MGAELIAAVATGRARSAIGVVRLSGEGAAECAGKVFQPLSGKALADCLPRTLVYGTVLDRDGRAIDKALCVWFPAEGSYTGEESAELQCHGSPMVLSLALEALFAHGARQALPGEFTRRAFLSGRLDLIQAEAVMDLIDAETPQTARQAAGQLDRALSERVEEVYSGLVDVMAHFHAVLDYPDEDVDPFTADVIRAALEEALSRLKVLLNTYDRGRLLSKGLRCAIVGRPNAGKSSLLNALVGYDRAIVTDVPGTTRDTVEEKCVLGGVLLRLTDTAGVRDTDDPVEKLGVERSRQAMEGAELILAVLDLSQSATEEDLALVRWAVSLAPTVIVENKCDLPRTLEWTEELDLAPAVSVSAKTGAGLEDLGKLIAQTFPQGTAEEAGSLLTNARQAEAAGRALTAVERAKAALDQGVTPDALLTDVEEALSALGELTGRTVREDVIGRVFERFCVGK